MNRSNPVPATSTTPATSSNNASHSPMAQRSATSSSRQPAAKPTRSSSTEQSTSSSEERRNEHEKPGAICAGLLRAVLTTKVITAALAAALLLLPLGAPASGHQRTSVATQTLLLGGRATEVQLERGSTIDLQPHPNREIGWYHIILADRTRFKWMLIGIMVSDAGFKFLEGRPEPICVNGFRGSTETDDERQIVALAVPPQSAGLYRVIFEFDRQDAAAWAVVRSIRISGQSLRHC